MRFEEIVGRPDGVEEMYWVEAGILVVLLSDATGIIKEGDEEAFIDTDGDPDDTDGADVTLALALGNPVGVELWISDRSEALGRVKGGIVGVELLAELVSTPKGDDVAETEDVPVAVVFEEIVESPDEDGPPDKVLLDEVVGRPDGLEADNAAEELLLAELVGSPDGAELVGNPLDELFSETVDIPGEAVELGYPDRSETLSEPKGGIVPEELLVGMVGTPDGAEVVEKPVNKVLEAIVDNADAAVDTVGVADEPGLLISPVDELLEESVGTPDGVEEVPL